MANVIDETENALVLLIVLGIVGALAWVAWKSGALHMFGGTDGVSFSDNLNRWWGLLFGSDADTAPDPGSATAVEQQSALDNYVQPTASQISQAAAEAPIALSDFWQTLETNPGSLPVF